MFYRGGSRGRSVKVLPFFAGSFLLLLAFAPPGPCHSATKKTSVQLTACHSRHRRSAFGSGWLLPPQHQTLAQHGWTRPGQTPMLGPGTRNEACLVIFNVWCLLTAGIMDLSAALGDGSTREALSLRFRGGNPAHFSSRMVDITDFCRVMKDTIAL
ncbi:hypothetical protein B0T13DRAFT_54788 [Neurospora crassa]|nr:hypothetical protein B0T13DRAFT_54788 [Neurospora crassa]